LIGFAYTSFHRQLELHANAPRVPALMEEKPELKTVEPFKTVLCGNHKAIVFGTLD
jgi:hypothetical protein